MLVVLKLSPYVQSTEDWTSFISTLTLTITTIGGFAMAMNAQLMERNEKPQVDSEHLAVLLIGISALSMVTNISITIFIDCGVLEMLCGGKKKTTKKSAKKVTPVSQEDDTEEIRRTHAAEKAWSLE